MSPVTRRHLRCRTCGGTYHDHLADGTEYYHACPPLSDWEVARVLGLPADSSTWTEAQRVEVQRADRTRPNARDENVRGGVGDDAGTIKAVGGGVDTL